ncbi:MAG: pyridoxal phosphate-dependent aminotransferase [Clostridia bacterium]|nr:pyridoxal phosphate-dependent aminotransferase [Clostridia bacterium]
MDFDKPKDRTGTLSYKWDCCEGALPMWVADMDFEAPRAVVEAITKRASHGIYGYSYVPDEFFEAVSGYFARRHSFAIPTEWMIYSSGIVAAISSAVRWLTRPNENVLIQAPVYNIFYNSIINNGRRVLSSDLVYRDGCYSIDFADLEAKLADPQTSLMILCNPHNPVGKIWSGEELAKIGELAHRYGVIVLSDEIHCDLTLPGLEYTPFASVNDTCADIAITAVAGSKTFNIAGLQSAVIAVKDPILRHRVWRGINTDEVGEPNAFAIQGCIAAFNQCDEWVDGLRAYLAENRRVAEEYIRENIPMLSPVSAEATYLLWVDVSSVCSDSVKLVCHLVKSAGLFVSDGAEYGECGRGFIRINLGTRRALVLEGMERLKKGIEAFFG